MVSASDVTVMTSLIQLIQLAADPSSMDNSLVIPDVSSAPTLDCNTVQFYLVTRSNMNGPPVKACLDQTKTIFDGTFDSSKPTKILVHGWMNSRTTLFTVNVTSNLLKTLDANIIQVDWSAIAKENYIAARVKVPEVGKTVAAFITRLVEQLNVNLSDMHLIGHSLGSQVIGVAGYQFQPPNQIKTVTGLDPAGPLFWTTGSDGMITKESGEFVVILHTCAGLLGTTRQLGDVDFYANGGTPIQPGCGFDLTGTCSHNRAIALFDESLRNPTAFETTKCSSYLLYELGFCKSNDQTYLGLNVDRNVTGRYYFKTSSTFPYTS